MTSESPLPDLQDTCEDLAEFYNGNTARIREMIAFMVNQELLELDKKTGRLMCPKVYKFLQSSQTRSEYIKNLIKSYVDVQETVQIEGGLSQTVSDSLIPSEIVTDCLRLSEIVTVRTEQTIVDKELENKKEASPIADADSLTDEDQYSAFNTPPDPEPGPSIYLPQAERLADKITVNDPKHFGSKD